MFWSIPVHAVFLSTVFPKFQHLVLEFHTEVKKVEAQFKKIIVNDLFSQFDVTDFVETGLLLLFLCDGTCHVPYGMKMSRYVENQKFKFVIS